MKKTLLISEIFPPVHGGSGRWFWELYSRLPSEDYVIAAGDSENAESFDQTHDLDILRLDLSSRSWAIRSLEGLRFYWRAFRDLRKVVKTRQIGSIHCGRCLPEGVFGYLFSKIYSIPYLCYIHGEDIETAASSRELSIIVRKVLLNAKLLICNSSNTRSILLDSWSTSPDKTLVLNPGVDAKKFVPARDSDAVRKELNWGNRPVVLTVGRLQKRKGQDMLIEALPIVRQACPDILYAIVGDGAEKKALEASVRRLDLQNHVAFLSEIEDHKMIQCYQQCTIFALPNRTIGRDIEGFGMVLVEAQSCGKPVIAGNSGGTSETMIPGETGFIVDCTRPEPLAAKIVELLNDRGRLATMGSRARSHVAESLDWDAHARKALDVFKILD